MKEDSGVASGLTARPQPGTSVSHTPGPWKVLHDIIISRATYDTICAVKGPTNRASTFLGSDDEHVQIEAANASLITAAPDLLEALADLLTYHDVPGPVDAPLVPLMRAAFAAIAKAEGRDQ